MARTQFDTKTAPKAEAPQSGNAALIDAMNKTAQIIAEALVAANRAGIPLHMTVGNAGVETTEIAEVLVCHEGGREFTTSRLMAMQAGLLLGAARASEELDRG